LVICAFAFLVFVVPQLDAVFGHRSGENVLTPAWRVYARGDDFLFSLQGLLAIGLGGLAIAISFPRVAAGVREVLAASRARREREAAA
jgi:hypothetical protein